MIDVTERAKGELKRLLTTNVDWPEARLRLMDRGNGVLGLGIDIETPGDEIVEHEGKAVLIIAPKLANHCTRITLDVDETPGGVELVIIESAMAQSPVAATAS